jgi:uncharacterized protein (DUF2235 family)
MRGLRRLFPKRPTVIYLFGWEPTEYVARLFGQTVHVVGLLRIGDEEPIPVALTGEVIHANQYSLVIYDDKSDKYAAFDWSDIKKVTVPQ